MSLACGHARILAHVDRGGTKEKPITADYDGGAKRYCQTYRRPNTNEFAVYGR